MAVLEGKQDVREETHGGFKDNHQVCGAEHGTKMGDKPRGGGVEDNESHFGQADEQSFDASVTKRGPQGWYGSWPRLLAISMAAWPMGPPQPCSSAEDCSIPGAPRALGGPKTAACPLLHQDTHGRTQELTRYPCGGESSISVQLGHGAQVFGQTSSCIRL